MEGLARRYFLSCSRMRSNRCGGGCVVVEGQLANRRAMDGIRGLVGWSAGGVRLPHNVRGVIMEVFYLVLSFLFVCREGG